MNRRRFLQILGLTAAAITVNPIGLLTPPTPKPIDRFALIRRLIAEAVQRHDELIERAIFSSNSNLNLPASLINAKPDPHFLPRSFTASFVMTAST